MSNPFISTDTFHHIQHITRSLTVFHPLSPPLSIHSIMPAIFLCQTPISPSFQIYDYRKFLLNILPSTSPISNPLLSAQTTRSNVSHISWSQQMNCINVCKQLGCCYGSTTVELNIILLVDHSPVSMCQREYWSAFDNLKIKASI